MTSIFGVRKANGFAYMISFIINQTSFMMTFTNINTNIKHQEHHLRSIYTMEGTPLSLYISNLVQYTTTNVSSSSFGSFYKERGASLKNEDRASRRNPTTSI